jgi:hypothetical protein
MCGALCPFSLHNMMLRYRETNFTTVFLDQIIVLFIIDFMQLVSFVYDPPPPHLNVMKLVHYKKTNTETFSIVIFWL